MDFILHFLQYNPGKGFLFTGIGFWIFLAIVLAGFCLLHRKRQARNTFLFACSLFFFYKMAGAFLLILLLSILLNYGIGLQTSAAPDCSKKRWMTAGIIANLLILAVFKYNAFFIQSFNALFDTGFTAIDYFSADYLSSAFAGPAWFESLFPPVGLSFFTLQAISYLVDIKRGSAKAISNIADFGLYYCFFPKAIAGPIVRTGEFAPQLRQYYMLSRKEFSIALGLIITGLIKKIIFADYLALHSSPAIFMQPEMYSGMEKWIALYAFSLRIYMDFSGYADIAIGIAALLGFQLPGNFRAPYQACTLTDFWRRWHISLSSWLRDYAYIPLGGNRHGKWKMCIALTAVFLMAALWHEAGMGFLLWGLVHGVLVCIEKCTAWPERVEKKRFGKIAGWFLTFNALSLSWILFRTSHLQQAADYFFGLFVPAQGTPLPEILSRYSTCFALTAIAFIGIFLKEKQKNALMRIFYQSPMAVQFLITAAIAVLLILARGYRPDLPFIYGQVPFSAI